MKIKAVIFGLIALSLASLSLFGGPSQLKTPAIPTGPNIQVLLTKDATSALLEVKGSYRVVRNDTGETLSNGKKGKCFVVHAIPDGLRWGEEYPDVYEFSVVPQSADAFVYVDGIQYKGDIAVYFARNNRVTLVNRVPIEEYLKSTLSLKYTTPIDKEALAALVIAERTEAFSTTLSESACPWDITAEEAGYFGTGVGKRALGVEEMIDATRFMVVESTKKAGQVQTVALSSTEAVELASQGFDAKKIVTQVLPHTKLGLTINPSEIALK